MAGGNERYWTLNSRVAAPLAVMAPCPAGTAFDLVVGQDRRYDPDERAMKSLTETWLDAMLVPEGT